jgi:hypothetical protein
MCRRVNVTCPDAVAGFEACWRRLRSPERAACHNAVNVGLAKFSAFQGLSRAQRMASRDFVGVDKRVLKKGLLETEKPSLVVGTGQIDMWRKQFDAVSRHINIPRPGCAHRAAHRHRPGFPWMMKDRLIRLGYDFAEAIHTAHVVDAVH